MHIRWVLSSAAASGSAETLQSSLASYRYRAAIPMAALRKRGHTCSWHGVMRGEAIGADRAALVGCDVLVFGKNHSEQNEVAQLLDRARTNGVPTIVDMCDDYFEPGHQHEPYYRFLASAAGTVTASSEQLAEAIEAATGVEAAVVRDPYEGPGSAPRWSPAVREINALWFGTPFNLEALLNQVVELPQRIRGYALTIEVLTSVCDGLEDAFRNLNAQNAGKLTLLFREWSLERNWTALEACDLVVIPVKQDARFFQAKGANRLVEALRAGRFVVANAMPAYQEFRPWAWIGDLAEGIEWALDHPREVLERIAGGQRYVDANYSPAAIAADWEAAINPLVARRKP